MEEQATLDKKEWNVVHSNTNPYWIGVHPWEECTQISKIHLNDFYGMAWSEHDDELSGYYFETHDIPSEIEQELDFEYPSASSASVYDQSGINNENHTESMNEVCGEPSYNTFATEYYDGECPVPNLRLQNMNRYSIVNQWEESNVLGSIILDHLAEPDMNTGEEVMYSPIRYPSEKTITSPAKGTLFPIGKKKNDRTLFPHYHRKPIRLSSIE